MRFAVAPDPEQRFLYVVEGSNKAIRILDRRTLETLASVGGHAGHDAREFLHIHSIAADSKGNLFLGESQQWAAVLPVRIPRHGSGMLSLEVFSQPKTDQLRLQRSGHRLRRYVQSDGSISFRAGCGLY